MHTFLFCRSAQVNCLYFVARETLDDVLWKLIEKKFRDLGEFVEGQEKLKLVIDKEYRGAKELQSALFHVEDDGSDDEDGPTDTTNVDRELEFDADLVHDIEEMGEEEERMLRLSEDPDDERQRVVGVQDGVVDHTRAHLAHGAAGVNGGAARASDVIEQKDVVVDKQIHGYIVSGIHANAVGIGA